MAWYKEYPRRKAKSDLIGEPLFLDPNKPPVSAGGRLASMLRLIVHTEREEPTGKAVFYEILVTEQDVGDILEIYDIYGCFTFVDIPGEEFPKASRWIPEPKEAKGK